MIDRMLPEQNRVPFSLPAIAGSALPAARLLVLESSSNLRLPAHLGHGVELIGFPDDNALGEIIRIVSLGLSTSLWEGYNLPLVEGIWFEIRGSRWQAKSKALANALNSASTT